MSEHDKKVIIKFARWLYEQNLLYSIDVDYDWDENPYETITSLDPMINTKAFFLHRMHSKFEKHCSRVHIEVGSHSLLQGIFPTQGLNQVSCIVDRFFTV